MLTALAAGPSSYLVNNVRAVNDQLYIATAGDVYLDERLAEFGIVRPPAVGLSDDVFRQIGIGVKNRKQVRDLINELLDAIFGDEFVRASNQSRQVEPYNLVDGDQLIINFDEANTVPITFHTNEFASIAAATAQEVADAITKNLRTLGFSGTAIAKDDGNGPFVEILSDTIGPISSVTVRGGRAQNELKFDAPVAAGGNGTTQWTLSLRPGGIIRFTWSGGANPQLGKVSPGNYVNIFGGGFASSTNEGSYTITASVGGLVNESYFEIENPIGTSGVIVQGTATAVLFFNPVRKTVASRTSYAAVYQTQGRVLQIFLPAATKVIRRDRIGSAHLHYAPQGTFTFSSNASIGDQFSVTTVNTFVADSDFAIGATAQDTIVNLAAAINAVSGLDATVGDGVLSVFNDSTSLTLTMTFTGIGSIVASGPQGDPQSVEPDQEGPYMFDLSQPFTVSEIGTLLAQDLDGTMSRVFSVVDSSQFPDEQGYLIFGYGTQEQEGPVPYISRPSNNTLLISPSYTIKTLHPEGTDVAFVAQKAPVSPSRDGTDFEFYITDVVSGRIYAQDLINSVAATGINIVFTILYPSDIGLGKWGTQFSENPVIWGE
ncbi:MAG: hypothetical protein OIN85_00805 [Candidatus Methanoperedens sp.]|nr:hypothetical protein [Candidatus Methanoperedens sp.]